MITEKEIREWYHSNDTYFGNSEEFLKGILIYLKQKGVIKKSALEEARELWEQNMYKNPCMEKWYFDYHTAMIRAIAEKDTEIERLERMKEYYESV